MKKISTKAVLVISIFGVLLLPLFQNCAPAKLTSSGDIQLSSTGAAAAAVGDKVDLPSLLAAPKENPSNVAFPASSSTAIEHSYSVGTPMIENVVLTTSDFSSVIWVHGPSSVVLSKGAALEDVKFSSDLLGPVYVFGFRNETAYLIASYNIVGKGTTNLNVNSVGAVQVVPSTLSTSATSETILVQVDAPDVDLNSVQFKVQNALPTTDRRAILMTKNLTENLNVQVDLSDMSGQSYSQTLNFPAKTIVPLAPALRLSALTLNFGNVTLGSTSAAQSLVLTNSGTAPLAFTSGFALTSDFSLSGNTCSTTVSLAPGAACTLNVKFSPSALGLKSGELKFSTNASSLPHSVALTGTGVDVPTPALSLSAASLNFGSVTLGASSDTQQLIITNTGAANLTFTSAIAVSAGFSFTGNCSTATPLAPGASCSLNLKYTPSIVGSQSGTLTIASNATASPKTVSLTGTGLAAPAPILTLSATTFNFGSAAIGTSSTTQPLVIVNSGNANLIFTSAIAISSNFTFTGDCSTSTPLAPGASCILNLKYVPSTVGTQSGTLTISSNATASPKTVSLSGTGLSAPAPVLTLSATAFNFGSVVMGSTSAEQTLILTNTGSASLSFTTYFAFTANFTGYGTCYTTIPLAPGESCVLKMTYKPSAVGTQSGTVTIKTNASATAQIVNLSGTGISAPAPTMSLSTTAINFGNVTLGSSSGIQSLLIMNSGTTNLTFTSAFAISAGFSFTGTCSTATPLAPGGACSLNLKYTPTAVGPQTGNLTIYSNSSTPLQSVPLIGAGVSATPAAVVSGRNYKIIAACGAQTKVMGVAAGSLVDKAAIVLEPRDDTKTSQTFKFETYGTGFKVTAQNSGKTLNIGNASTAIGALLEQYVFTGVASEVFKVSTTTDGFYRLQSVNSGLYLNLIGGSTVDGTQFEQNVDSTSTCSQKFILSPM